MYENCDEDKIVDHHLMYGSVYLSSEFNTFVVIAEDWPSFSYASKGFSDGLVIVYVCTKFRTAWRSSMLSRDIQVKY